MLIMQVLHFLIIVAEGAIAFPILYLCLLSVSALFAAKRRRAAQIRDVTSPSPGLVKFAILVPAHDEEEILGSLLGSLAELDYPKDRYTVCVIADNCTDRTAEIARLVGWVRVYERVDETKRGKGHALKWIFQQLDTEHLAYDACVVLDADSLVDPAFLRAMERELARGAQALQAYNGVLNTADSPSTALRWLALALMNHVRPLGRNGLRCSSTLTGNGMCLHHDLLQRYPWQALALSEDYQYYLSLVERGERVQYVPEAVVRSEMPATFNQMKTQDVRWESYAGSQPAWRIALRLLRAGLRSPDLIRFEAIAELLTPPLSLLVGWCLLTLCASVVLFWLPGMIVSLLVLAGLICYLCTPLLLLHPPRAVYTAFLYAPGFMAWKLWVYFVVRKSSKYTKQWVRTSRNVS